jgi:hypothetical protein
MRIQNEQSGSTSLFAQPLAIEPIPEEQGTERQGTATLSSMDRSTGAPAGIREQGAESGKGGAADSKAEELESHALIAAKIPRGVLESRLETAFDSLARNVSAPAPSSTIRQGHLALLKRWYYRPEAKRAGEIFFPDAEDHWPVKSILRGIGRVAAKSILPPPQS